MSHVGVTMQRPLQVFLSRKWLAALPVHCPECFREEMMAMTEGRDIDPVFNRLERRLREFNITIPRPTGETFKEVYVATGAARP